MAHSIWKERLRVASWRGIEFFIDDHDFETGLNTVTHEFPDREKPFTEDFDRKSRTFNVNGHILGDNYFQKRDELIAACEQRGAGVLVHPYLGERTVKCSSFRVKEDTTEGRIASISFQFVESGEVSFPRAADDKAEILKDQTSRAGDGAVQEFQDNFSVAGLPGEMVESAINEVNEAADRFDEATQGVQTASDEIADLAFNLRNLKADINDLVNQPEDLANRLRGSINLLTESGLSSKDGFRAAGTLFNFGESPTFQKVDINTPSRNQQNQNTDAIKNLVRQLAISEGANQAVNAQFESVEEAVEERQRIKSVIDEQLGITQNDDLFQALRDVNATITDAVPDKDADIPNIVEFDLLETQPAIVLVHDLFESAELEQDLIDRNGVRHPGFVLGGQQIEVLNRA